MTKDVNVPTVEFPEIASEDFVWHLLKNVMIDTTASACVGPILVLYSRFSMGTALRTFLCVLIDSSVIKT